MGIFRSNIGLVIILFSSLVVGQENVPMFTGSPFITIYYPEDFLDAGKTWRIGQGIDGKMYFANNYGLDQFDGYEWERIGKPQNLSELRSFAIQGEKIFIGGTSEIGYFFRDSLGGTNYVLLNKLIKDPNFSFDDVWDIVPFKESIFFLTDNGMMKYQGDSIEVLMPGTAFRASTYGIDELVFASNNKGLYRFKEDSLMQLTSAGQLDKVHITFVLAIQPQTYLIGTVTKGIFLFDGKVLKTWNSAYQGLYIDKYLNQATILNKDHLLFGSLHDGLIITDYNGNLVNIINEKDGLLDHNILAIYKDHQGNIWAAVDGSIAYLELNNPFTILNKKNGLRGEIYAILKYKDDLYVGTSRGLYMANWRQKGPKGLEFKLVPNSAGQCWQLFEYEGSLLLAHHNGIYLIKNGQANYIGGNGNWNFAALPNHPGLLLTGNYTGVALLKKTGNTFEVLHQIEGFQETAREVILEGKKVWISHGYKGIYSMNLTEDLKSFENIELYATPEGLPSDLYNTLTQIDKGVFVGTQNGVYQYNEQTNRMEPNPLFTEILGTETLIRKLKQAPNGNYFSIKNYSRTDEIALIEVLEDGSFSLKENPFQKLRGKLIPAFEAIEFIENEQVLIGSKQGLIIYDGNFGETSPKNHQCYINEISLPLRDTILFKASSEKNLVNGIPIRLGAAEILRVSFNTSFYESIPYTQYSTYLEGYDEDWQEWTTDSYREWVGLKERSYTLWVKSRNIYDVEGQSTAITFHIKNDNQRVAASSVWLFALLLLFVSGLFYYFLRRTIHSSEDLSQKLKKELEQKQSKLDNYREKKVGWKKEKELINQKLSDALLKNEIHAGLIQKIEVLAEQNSSSKAFQKAVGDFQEQLKEVQIQFDAHKTLETDDFLTRIKKAYPDLSPRELRLCSYLKLNVSSKEIADYLGISLRGVESLRYRVRKKLKLNTGQDLTEFILKL